MEFGLRLLDYNSTYLFALNRLKLKPNPLMTINTFVNHRTVWLVVVFTIHPIATHIRAEHDFAPIVT